MTGLFLDYTLVSGENDVNRNTLALINTRIYNAMSMVHHPPLLYKTRSLDSRIKRD